MGGGGSKTTSSSYNPFESQFGAAVGQLQQANIQGLTPAEEMQLQLINQGRSAGQQQIRDEATARGLFSSGGAIMDEALLEQELARQRAGVYGQAQQRYMGGLGQVAQLYGSQQRTTQTQREGGGFLGGVGGLLGAGAGFLVGGPQGAVAGSKLGSGGSL